MSRVPGDVCEACGGVGMGTDKAGEPMECPQCGGTGHVGEPHKWCWQYVDGGYHGDYPTREGAIHAARMELDVEPGTGVKVKVGRQVDFVPRDFVPEQDLDEFLGTMDSLLEDNESISSDGPMFEVREGATSEQATAALLAVMEAWAAEWLTTTMFKMADGEEVEL